MNFFLKKKNRNEKEKFERFWKRKGKKVMKL